MENCLTDIEYNYKTICENIEKAAFDSGRAASDIVFLAATKTVDTDRINHAISLGLKYIGENRVQELLSKYDSYDLEHASLHFIGHLQTNKVRQIVGKADLIQSVDSVKLAKEISKESIKRNIVSDILVEINIGDEISKSGISFDETYSLLDEIREIPSIRVKGLMCIPPICENTQENIRYFDNMHKLFIDIKDKKIDNISMDILSMGMSSDYEDAVRHGANMVRIGSSLFGARIYK